MAIKIVRVQVNGTWTSLKQNAETGIWEGTLTAPGATSYHLSGGYYPVTVEAANEAGTTAAAGADAHESLRLVVRETVKPVITITSPGAGAYLASNQEAICFTLRDEAGGSGIDLPTLRLTLDGTVLDADSAGMVCAAVTDGYNCVYTPPEALADGAHTVTVAASDHDGNAAAEVSRTFTVDTVPPALNVVSPVDGLITATAACTVQGTTNDATSSPVTVSVTLSGADQGAVTVGEDGSFRKALTLAEGDNTITVTATDRAGRTTETGLSVRLDTSQPVIGAVTLTPNPVNAGETMRICIEVT